jgi:hypothetical protein
LGSLVAIINVPAPKSNIAGLDIVGMRRARWFIGHNTEWALSRNPVRVQLLMPTLAEFAECSALVEIRAQGRLAPNLSQERLASASYPPAPLATVVRRSSMRANLINFWILGLAPISRRSPPELLIGVRQENKTPMPELSA